ncbi:hypothetical protein [Thiomonas sp.]
MTAKPSGNLLTLYIVPTTLPKIAGQRRIVGREGDWSARDSYRNDPSQWKEMGLMASDGHLVCLDAGPEAYLELKSCEPLMAGLQIRVIRPVEA